MSILILGLEEGSFVSYRDMYENFSDLKYLLVKNCSKMCCEFDKIEALMKFDTRLIPENILIKNAILELPIKTYTKCNNRKLNELNISINKEGFREESVTFENRPHTTFYASFIFGSKELKKSFIAINITELLEMWMKKIIPNNGVTLSLKSKDISLELYKIYEKCQPTIYIEYSEKIDKKTQSIQLQSTNLKGKVIESNGAFKFNKVIVSNDIDYYDNSGEIKVKESGEYLANWWISIGGSEDIEEISIAIENVTNKSRVYSTSPVNISSQITGNAIISIKKGEVINLINSSTGEIQMDNVNIQASLIMVKV